MVSDVIWLDWKGATYGLQALSGLQVLPDSHIEKMAYLIGAKSTTTYPVVYTIIAYEDGRPKTCSCPHFTKAIDAQGTHPYCKHLQMAERWWRENTEVGKEAQKLLEQQAVAVGFNIRNHKMRKIEVSYEINGDYYRLVVSKATAEEARQYIYDCCGPVKITNVEYL